MYWAMQMIIVITPVLVVTYAIMAGDVALSGQAGTQLGCAAPHGIVTTPCGRCRAGHLCWPPDGSAPCKKWLPWHTSSRQYPLGGRTFPFGLAGQAVGPRRRRNDRHARQQEGCTSIVGLAGCDS